MKPVITYILYLTAVIFLAALLNLCFSSVYQGKLGYLYLEMKPYILADLIGCLSLLTFYMRSAYQSVAKILVICGVCFILVTFLGYIISYLTIYYSNIPEVVVMYIHKGWLLNLMNAVAAFVTSGIAAVILISKRKSPFKKPA